jgi:hypothetical protein
VLTIKNGFIAIRIFGGGVPAGCHPHPNVSGLPNLGGIPQSTNSSPLTAAGNLVRCRDDNRDAIGAWRWQRMRKRL